MSRRMAGEVQDGLDRLIKEIRDEGKEELKQEAIVQMRHPEVSIDGLMGGTSRTAEQQVARGLLFEGKMPDVLPADLYSASDLTDKSELGIAGPYKQDSAIKQSTTGGLNSKGELEVEHHPIRTEYLSADTEERLFGEWKRLNNSTSRRNFNAGIGEYYGQQALKAVGNTPVADDQRSFRVRQGKRNDYSEGRRTVKPVEPGDSTLGTDRLIENSAGLLNPDIDQSGDYRYVSPEGYLTVGDYQTGELRDTVRLNLLKSLSPGVADTFKQKYPRGVEILQEKGLKPTPDNVVRLMLDDGVLPPIKRQARDAGIRGGKALSDSPTFREANIDDQYRYNEYLFGHGQKDNLDQPYGYMPEEMILVDLAKANQALGDKPGPVRLHGRRDARYDDMGADVAASISDLMAAGAAKRLSDDPRVKQLLQ